MIALIDCNNFFVSCERLFRPDLENRPVVVLSSNDGCAVSRSNETKALGVPMGAPFFKYRQLFRQQGVTHFSGNFELYGDISQRIIRLLTGITPRTEVYSVDESFLDLGQMAITDYTAWGRTVRRKLLREVGIPVSIGIAPTKTLAKLGAEQAKHDEGSGGVLDLASLTPAARAVYLLGTPINDVWGVGRRLTPRLRAEGIHNALDLSRMPPRLAQQLMGVHGRQMVAELNGTRCYPLEPFGRIRQTVMHGRQFGEDTGDPLIIESAIASLTARAAGRLRADHLLARGAAVRLATNRHRPGYQRLARTLSFVTPTADTGLIAGQLVAAVQAAYNPRVQFHRADVLLFDLASEHRLQTDLLGNIDLVGSEAAHSRLQAFDSINQRYGQGVIRYAAEDLSAAWQPHRGHRSPRYTTSWEELPVIRIVPTKASEAPAMT
ncbi:MAG TPA: Y-family DNA polymerase [Candidatus Dormibacteraeota bacterium]|nr:Y-family DNA polymerase [Candidatus Dormibacteraeota bacterium]